MREFEKWKARKDKIPHANCVVTAGRRVAIYIGDVFKKIYVVMELLKKGFYVLFGGTFHDFGDKFLAVIDVAGGDGFSCVKDTCGGYAEFVKSEAQKQWDKFFIGCSFATHSDHYALFFAAGNNSLD